MTQARARSSRATWVARAAASGRRSPSASPGGGSAGRPTTATSDAPRTSAGSGAPHEATKDTGSRAASTGPPDLGPFARAAASLRGLAASTSLCPACLAAPCGALGLCAPCARLLHGAVAQLPAPSGATLWLGPHAGILRRLVHALKYRGAYRLAPFMAELLLARIVRWQWRPDIIVHLPTSAARRRLRGYDQAQLLAAALSRQSGLPHRNALVRRSGSGKLVGQGRAARAASLAGAFRAHGVNGRRLLLVDDVLTSGATLAAGRRAAALAGAAEVRAAVVARTAPAHEDGDALSAALRLLAPRPAVDESQCGHDGGQDA